MAVRVNFEIGHEASIRTKRTPEGFTHDWEVFVRGHEGANISYFVEKVVFHLHETFPKPKRVVKEPPYSIKESGYGGFTLPIEIYLKNKDEPKKIKFIYELSLQSNGCMKDRYIFHNPNDEFKKKLMKGGGIIVNNHLMYANPEQESRETYSDDKPQLISKPKLSSDSIKKPKVKEELPKPLNKFENLFGTPLQKPSKVSPEPKKVAPPVQQQVVKTEKKEKDRSSGEKEKKKSEHKEKSEKKDKDRLKEEKSKSHPKETEKMKENKSHKRPSDRPPSPQPAKKRCPSPKRPPSPSSKSTGSVSSKEEDTKPQKIISDQPEVKKMKLEDKPPDLKEKEKKKKKNHDKDKERRKEHKKESHKSKEAQATPVIPPEPKEQVREPPTKEIVKEKPPKQEKSISKFSIENFKAPPAETKQEEMKVKEKSESERKHKHKKKDKKRDDSREKHKDREKKHKHDKHKEHIEHKEIPAPEPPLLHKEKTNPPREEPGSPISIDTSSQSSCRSVKSKQPGIGVEDITSSSQSDSDDDLSFDIESKAKTKLKTTPQPVEVKPPTPKPEPPPPIQPTKVEEPSPGTSSKEKRKHKDKSKSKEERKQKKRKSSSKPEEGEPKANKVNDGSHPRLQVENGRSKSETKVQDNGVSSSLGEDGPNSPLTSPEPEPVREESPTPAELSPDYMLRLRELQQRIMTIKSNDELERVVNLIAETGRYEITTHTFDFDLCLLDRSTVQQLIQMIG